jgi:hypothetical protein
MRAWRRNGFLARQMLFAIALICTQISTPTNGAGPDLAEGCVCKGCGCKGGPGWRKNGRCVSHANLMRDCGDPPGAPRCTFEGAIQICSTERGCGRRGGPGWRDKAGQCVPRKQLKQICGYPPNNTLCTFEGPLVKMYFYVFSKFEVWNAMRQGGNPPEARVILKRSGASASR